MSRKICRLCRDNWNCLDEMRWDNYRIVVCPFKERIFWKKAKVFENPPGHCPFILEHTINQGEIL